MQAYENGGPCLSATLPTDALIGLRDAMARTREMGFEARTDAMATLGMPSRRNWRSGAYARSRRMGFYRARRRGLLYRRPRYQIRAASS